MSQATPPGNSRSTVAESSRPLRHVNWLHTLLKGATWIALAIGLFEIGVGWNRRGGDFGNEMSFLGATVLVSVSLVGLLLSEPKYDD